MRAICRLCVVIVLFLSTLSQAGDTIPLWENGAPDANGNGENDTPTLTIYHAAGTNRPAVLLCPGGGYKHISGHRELATWFNGLGISVFVLKYRLPVNGYVHPAPLNDAKRAMRTIRRNTNEWKLDSKRIGVMGFSSGGHVATTLATHVDAGDPAADDPVERNPCRPDFMLLQCPVVTFGEHAHRPSRVRLLGNNADPELIKDLSSELQVSPKTPPTFLAHSRDDRLVSSRNSELFYEALLKAGVEAELKLYETGGHGVRNAGGLLWLDDGKTWLTRMGFTGKVIPVR